MRRETLLKLVLAEEERRKRERIHSEFPRYDWFGEDCGCPAEGRREGGSCPAHPRARENQRMPEGDWNTWYIEAGRGFGKTRSGAEVVRRWADTLPPKTRIALVGPTAADVRDVMIEGESGLLEVCPPWNKPVYLPSKRKVVWPNKTVAFLYSADEPERLRGPQHHKAWCDEMGAWDKPLAYDMLKFGLRLGDSPQDVITTTPKPKDWLRAIKKQLGTYLTKGSTYDNKGNLAKKFFDDIIKKYEGTRLGEQELNAVDHEDTPGALWNTDMLVGCACEPSEVPDFLRVVVAVDPSVKDPNVDPDNDSAECGIVVVGVAYLLHPLLGPCLHAWVIADLSLKASPRTWGQAAVDAYHHFGADVLAAEVNNGGALVEAVIHGIDPNVNFKELHASRGKYTRAEPVSSLYEQGRVYHVRTANLAKLEAQMCNWVPTSKSPDRMDALVWAITEAVLEALPAVFSDDAIFEGYRG